MGASSFLSGCSLKRDERVNALFMESDVALLDEIGETIIPETDTPGAKAVGIGNFMAMMVLDCYEDKHQKAFTEGLTTFKTKFEEEHGDSFDDAQPDVRTRYLNKLDKEQREYTEAHRDNPEATPHYFRMMKELTLLGYFTSEIGCTQARRYIETPGRYDACIDYKKGDRAWAT